MTGPRDMPGASPLTSLLDRWLPAQPLRPGNGLGPDAPLVPAGGSWALHPAARLAAFVAAYMGLLALLVLGLGRPRGGAVGVPALSSLAALVSYLGVAVVIEERRPPFELAPRRLGGLAAGALIGGGLLLATAAFVALAGGYRFLGGSWPPQVWAPVASGLVVGVSEEIVFRGIALRLLEERVGTWAALVISAVVFGVFHGLGPGASLWRVSSIALGGGLCLGALYLVTRSLWQVIGYHAAWNATQEILGVDTDSARGALQLGLDGPDWLTGGAGNVESSVVAVGLQLAMAGWLCWLIARRGQVVAPRWLRRGSPPAA